MKDKFIPKIYNYKYMLHMAALNIVTTVDFFKNKINVQHGSEKQ